MELRRLLASNAYCGAMLTIIAGSLVLGCLQRSGTSFLPTAKAQSLAIPAGTMDVRIVGVSPLVKLPVKLVGAELEKSITPVLLPVSIQEIKQGKSMFGGARWDSIEVVAADK